MTRPTRKEREAWAEHMSRASTSCPYGCSGGCMHDDYDVCPYGYTPGDRVTVEPLPEKNPPAPRARHEEREQERLTTMAAREWWWPYYVHHMQERSHRREAQRGLFKGVKPGWPDVTLIIPARRKLRPWHDDTQVLAALELKAEERRPKTKYSLDKPLAWWLEWNLRDSEQDVMHGLTRSQAERLQILHGAGFATMVAYGAREAFDWLSERAGDKPSE